MSKVPLGDLVQPSGVLHELGLEDLALEGEDEGGELVEAQLVGALPPEEVGLQGGRHLGVHVPRHGVALVVEGLDLLLVPDLAFLELPLQVGLLGGHSTEGREL